MPVDPLRAIEAELAKLEPPPGNFIRDPDWPTFVARRHGSGAPRPGKVGAEISKEEARIAARTAGLRLLFVIQQELGSLSRVRRILQVRGFVNAIPDFEDHPFVIDGCSDLFIQGFGEAGRHVRTSVGVASLPNGIPVEIEAIVEIQE